MPEFTHNKDNPNLITAHFSPAEREMMASSPAENIRINRYMNLDKFKQLLEQKAIWFNRLDNFSDKHEGRSVMDWQSEKGGIKDWWRKSTLASCWNWDNDENFALWNIYLGDQSEGVCVVSTYNDFIDSMENRGNIEGYFVKYVPYGTTYPGLNEIVCASRKYDWYKYEKEFRFIKSVGQYYDKKGELIEVKLDDLIKGIILSPNISYNSRQIILDLLAKSGLDITPSDSIILDKI